MHKLIWYNTHRAFHHATDNPTILSRPVWDPDAVRQLIGDFLHITQGCIRELIFKDLEMVNNEPWRLAELLRIAREEIERAS